MAAERRARAVWEGTLLEGQGRPISNAIRDNVGIRLTAEPEG